LSEFDPQQPPILRTVGTPGETRTPADALQPHAHVNATAELVADLLAATGLVAADKLALVRGRAGATGSLAQAIIDEGVASSDGIARTLAARHHLPLVDLAVVAVADEAAKQIALHVLERIVAMPYVIADGQLHVAIADPANIHGIDELRLATRLPLSLAVASRDDIQVEIRRLTRASEAFGARAVLDEEAAALEAEEEEADDLEADDGISDAPLVRLVNSVIFQAAEDGASDIHFEPQEDSLSVRFRIDGVLHEVQRIPKRMAAGVTTRLKVLAKLDIAERRKPQDGRISLNAAAAGRTLDVRVATLPTVEGESVVMRLLDKSKKAPTLAELGLSESMQQMLTDLVMRPTGALLATGPTGSGKSTTLYAALAQINRPEINIITVEDPVEYRLPGVNQVQINTRAGLTFATALRSILRSDPDVVMVGEIRDGRDREDLDRGRPHGSLGAFHAAHERRAGCAHAPAGDGRGAVPRRRGSYGRARAAARAQALHPLLRDVPALGGRPAQGARLPRGCRGLRRDGVLPQAGLSPVWPDRLQGSDRRLPAPRDERAARGAGRAEGEPRGDRARGDRGRHAHALGRRHRKGVGRAHLDRRARPSIRLIAV